MKQHKHLPFKYIDLSYLKVKDSKIEGQGLFAKKDIPKHSLLYGQFDRKLETFIVPHTDYFWKEAVLPWDYLSLQIDLNFHIFTVAKNKQAALKNKEVDVYMNHSCNPNCGPVNVFETISLRDINKGEELTWDYRTIWASKRNSMMMQNCQCNSENCEKKVQYGKWKELQFQQLHWPFFMPYLRALITSQLMSVKNFKQLKKLALIQRKKLRKEYF